MMAVPRGVVFDLDGTLIDSSGDIVMAVNHALEMTDRPRVQAATILGFVGDGARLLCARAAGLAEEHPDVDQILERYLAYYLEHPIDHTRWMPYARAVLDELKHFQLAIATNKPRSTTDLVLGRLGVRSLFAVIATGDDPSGTKPSARPILEIAKQLGLEPGQLVMVGDGPQDVEAGRRAGCRTIGVLGGFLPAPRLRAAQPDVLVESLAELPQILSRWEDATVRAKTPSEPV
jgi:phosphoglycolate phosphatase